MAPDFQAPTASGTEFRLSELRGSAVVLYFYPEADTSGCTLESKGFRDAYPDFQSSKVHVIGISTDDEASQLAFAQKYSLPFPLIADHSKEVSRLYGVLGNGGRARRVTFYIDSSGKVVDKVDSRLPGKHVDQGRARFLSEKA